MKKNYLVADVETTGFKPSKGAVTTEVAFAIVDAETFEIITAYTNLIDIGGTEISDKIVELTGITQELCNTEGVPKEVVARDIKEALADTIFVAHNANFDANFVEEDLGVPVNREEMVDTLALSRRLEPQYSKHSLGVICERHDFNLQGAHRALNDVFATVELLKYFNSLEPIQ